MADIVQGLQTAQAGVLQHWGRAVAQPEAALSREPSPTFPPAPRAQVLTEERKSGACSKLHSSVPRFPAQGDVDLTDKPCNLLK